MGKYIDQIDTNAVSLTILIKIYLTSGEIKVIPSL